MEERDLVIIGGGPAGYSAAMRASQLGGKVTLVEQDTLGGTCINRGCIPTLARALENNPRGLSDELLELFAKHDAVIGVEAVPNVTTYKKVQTVFDVIDHVDYIVKLIGVNHVAIGTDTMFGDHLAFHKVMLKDMGMSGHDFPATHIQYIENPGQLPNVTRALVARGYSDDDIRKIIGGNVLRLLEKTIG